MLRKILITYVSVFLLFSCNYKPVHPSLWKFGNYEKRFSKVLQHYSNPEDSLKLKAARFLIDKMEGHFYFQSKKQSEIDNFIQHIDSGIALPFLQNVRLYEFLRCELVDNYVYESLQNGSLPEPNYRKQPDIKTISPEFLIENIEYAFKAWEFPWAATYTFDEFCNYILPYRYGTEPPCNWRKTLFEKYKWIADSVKNTNNPLEVADFIHKQFNHKLSISKALGGFHLTVNNNFEGKTFTSCVGQAGMCVCIFRALGIPATPVRIPNWGNRNYGHDITGTLDAQKKWHYYNFGYPETETELNFMAPKMYFMNFDKMQNYKQQLTDASAEFMNVSDVKIDFDVPRNADVYLFVFGNLEWMPIAKGERINSNVIFRNVGNKPTLFKAGVESRWGKPSNSLLFYTDSVGKVTLLKPDYANLQTVTLSRKYIFQNNTHLPRLNALIGAQFYVSDFNDFNQGKQIFSIDTILNYDYNLLKCNAQSGKFMWYKFPEAQESNFDGPAEIDFYTTINDSLKKIKGRYFGSPQLSVNHIDLMTDNNMLTFTEVWDCDEEVNLETGRFILKNDKQPVWFGMELDSAVTVTHVGICPRNDKNGIYPGMKYELFMWDDKWKSMGVKIALANTISFENIPDNALLWLRNLDQGKEERIFTMKNGEQVWW